MPEQVVTASTRAAAFSNYRSTTSDDGTVRRRPRGLRELLAELNCLSGGWPRYCGGELFVQRGSLDIRPLRKPAALFAWMQETFPGGVRWRHGIGYVTEAEFFEAVYNAAKRYVSVELSPHYPAMQDVCYLTSPVNPRETGCLEKLLNFFAPASPHDALLIRSLFLTAFWGTPSCSKPLFMISSDDGQGSGKSILARAVAKLCGAGDSEHYGGIEIDRGEGIEQIKQRLLSPESVTKRVVIIDNVRDNRINWSSLEALVTSPVISGKKMYIGESQRNNTFLWILTLNGPGASSDLAQRSILIKVEKSEYAAGRVEELYTFIRTHREDILGDIGACLSQPPFEIPTHYTRWATWEREILGRVGSTHDLRQKITSRQESIDYDREEAEIITERIESEMLHWGVSGRPVRIRRSTVIRLCQEATGLRMPNSSWGLHIKALHDKGFLPRLGYGPRDNTYRYYTWNTPATTPSALVQSTPMSTPASTPLATTPVPFPGDISESLS